MWPAEDSSCWAVKVAGMMSEEVRLVSKVVGKKFMVTLMELQPVTKIAGN